MAVKPVFFVPGAGVWCDQNYEYAVFQFLMYWRIFVVYLFVHSDFHLMTLTKEELSC